VKKNPSFDWQKVALPVVDSLSELIDTLQNHPVTLLQAPPGAGKSTLVPLALLQEKAIASGKKIILLEPRRLAAKGVATRMAELLGEDVGQSIGYRMRFDTRVSEKTIIEVITEGILTNMLISDNELTDVGMVIFDEFHERSIHADVSLALCLEAQQILRPDLKILIMSATLDITTLAEKLKAPPVISKGNMFPVEIILSGEADQRELPSSVVPVIQRALQETDGDILVFLPGQAEIEQTRERLKIPKNTVVYPLYGALPIKQQWKAIAPAETGRRKIVLSTSIAETSLTIEGVTTVIDSGFGRGSRYDANSALTRLVTYRISRDEADQRAGRAGRLRPGTCYRLWSKSTDQYLESHRKPEIMSEDLTPMTLQLMCWGTTEPAKLFWLDPPPSANIANALQLLEDLGAVEEDKVTALGQSMNSLPCHPRIANMLIHANEEDTLHLAADIAALLDEKDPTPDEKSIDINLRLDWVIGQRKRKSSNPLFKRIDRISMSYLSLFDTKPEVDYPYDPYDAGTLLTYAYPERIANSQGSRSYRYQLANSHVIKIDREDDLAGDGWLVLAKMNARDHVGKAFLGAAINPQDLSDRVIEKEVIKWNEKERKLICETQMRVGSLVLSSSPIADPSTGKIKSALHKAIQKSKGQLLNFDENYHQFMARVHWIKQADANINLPDLDIDSLIKDMNRWLDPYLMDVDSERDLKQINIVEALKHALLDFEQIQLIDRWTPEKLEVPSGSKININYLQPDQPQLSVKIQEIFGLTDTPKLCNGKIPVKIQLLSPGFKPVQLTSDLKSFWQSTYFEVRKELKRRYPKHYWPDNPLEAPPTNRAKPRK
jgi:ATP-dependent helicase HrpB